VTNVIRLAVSNDRKPVRACMTCRYFEQNELSSGLSKCLAVGGAYSDTERRTGRVCGPKGDMWEPHPPAPRPRPSFAVRVYRAVLRRLKTRASSGGGS
jgi:hypothetical protein